MRMLVAIALVSTLATAAGAQTAANPEENAVRQTFMSMSSDWTAANAAAIAKRWAPDGDMIVSDGSAAKGPAEVQKWFAAQFTGPYKGTSFKPTISSVRFVRPDVAIATGDWAIAGLPGGGTRNGKFTAMLVKEGGAWLTAAWRSFVPAKPAGSN